MTLAVATLVKHQNINIFSFIIMRNMEEITDEKDVYGSGLGFTKILKFTLAKITLCMLFSE